MKTTGELKGNASQPFAKTIYDPVIWNDAKLEKALKETLQDSANKSNCTIPREWDGITAEGYTIRGYFENGKVTSFYFD